MYALLKSKYGVIIWLKVDKFLNVFQQNRTEQNLVYKQIGWREWLLGRELQSIEEEEEREGEINGEKRDRWQCQRVPGTVLLTQNKRFRGINVQLNTTIANCSVCV